MKISYEWIKTLLPTLDLTPEQIGQRLLLAGFPVESIVAVVASDAKLDGVPMFPTTYVAPEKMKGQTLHHEIVIDVEVTSNRPDLLGHLGMARELSALTGTPLVSPNVTPAGPAGPDLAGRTAIKLEAAECPHYTARIIEGVRVAPSPAWLVRRLESMGLRPINNVVDITNYVLFEHSQPLHAFDYHKLSPAAGAEDGRAAPGHGPDETAGAEDGPAHKVRPIIVRRAVKGEKMVSIDGHLRDLDESMLVIADAARPVAIAGVMGGLDTEVGPTTTAVLLESAYFDPMSVRATARKLGLFSDSSFRFERGVDPGGIEAASNRAADLIVELAGGRALPGFAIDPASRGVLAPGHTPRVTMRLARLLALLGIEIPVNRVTEILAGLQLSPRLATDRQAVTVTVPSFRQDLRREVDLIEEVARVEGYDKIPVRDRIELSVRPPSFRQTTIRRIARGLCGLGFYETVSITFVTADRAELFARGPAGHLAVVHSSRKQENALRRSLLPSLLSARRHNETVQVKRADLFEIASVFDPLGQQPAGTSGTGILPVNSHGQDGHATKLPSEPLRVALCTDGDFRDARGVLEQVVGLLNRRAKLAFQPVHRAEFVPGQGAAVLLDGREIGLIGTVAELVRATFDLHQEVAVAELDVEPLLALAAEPKGYTPLSRFPAIERDLSILVDEAVTWRQVEETIGRSATPELEAVEFVDLFRGGAAKQFPAGKKSFTFTLRYRLTEGTLTNEQANDFRDRTVEALGGQLGAVLRDK